MPERKAMSLLSTVNITIDSLESIAGDLSLLGTTVEIDRLDADTVDHVRSELAGARQRILELTRLLHAERRIAR